MTSKKFETTASERNNELLIRLDEKMLEVLRRMGEQDANLLAYRNSSNTAHEIFDKRISTLENYRWFLLGIVALGSFIAPFIKDWITKGGM